jgi:hypothetical protein
MLKFKSLQDMQLFLLEVNRIDLISKVKSEADIPEELFESFIQGRRTIVPQLKNFRQSQASKASWRQNSYKMLRGVRSFHKSTAGKRFHRSLGRFLANRNPLKREGLVEGAFAFELCEFLKGISSIKTHYWIERGYFHVVDEEVDLLIFGDELLPALNRVEEATMRLRTLEDDDVDLLLFCISPNDLQLELAEINQCRIEQVRKICSETYALQDMDACGSYIAFLDKTLNRLTEMLPIKHN